MNTNKFFVVAHTWRNNNHDIRVYYSSEEGIKKSIDSWEKTCEQSKFHIISSHKTRQLAESKIWEIEESFKNFIHPMWVEHFFSMEFKKEE